MMRIALLFIAILSCSYFLASCGKENSTVQSWTESSETIRSTWAADRRVAVYDIELVRESGNWKVEGETSVHEALEELQVMSNRILPAGHQFNVKLLPDAELGDSVYALVRISVANLRSRPGHTNELVDQVILGTRLNILKKQGGWYYVQTPYGYLGWMTGASVATVNKSGLKKWKRSDLRQIDALVTFIRDNPDNTSRVVNDATFSATVKLVDEGRSYARVELPDGRSGYLPASHLREIVQTEVFSAPDGNRIVETAMEMHGIPYLWGGNSTKGFDCSGFTQTVYRANAYQLPRDASQQVTTGEEVQPDEDFSNVHPGDLIFFGPENRITHVGISLGGPKFIHASAYVEINSLNPEDPDYSEYRRNSLRYVKRITDVLEE